MRRDPEVEALRERIEELESQLTEWRTSIATEVREELITAAYTYLDRFVDVDEALIDGFDLAAWSRRVDELDIPARRQSECRATSWQLEGYAICRRTTGHDGGAELHPNWVPEEFIVDEHHRAEVWKQRALNLLNDYRELAKERDRYKRRLERITKPDILR